MRSRGIAWTTLFTKLGFSTRNQRNGKRRVYGRKLHFEQCEERRVLATIVVTNLGDGFVSGPGDQPGTLRQAIFDADNIAGPDTIQFDPTVFANGGTITLTAGELTISDSVTIDGRNSSGVPLGITIDAGGGTDGIVGNDSFDGHSIFFVSGSSGQFELNGLTLTGADSEFFGGAIACYGPSLSVKNTVITGNAGLFRGGGIYTNGDLTVESSTITGNSTLGAGGGVYFNGNDTVLNVVGSTISGNDAFEGGGGIFARSHGHVSIQSSHITGNQTADRGGGIYFYGMELTLQSSEVRDNGSSGLYGGGLYATVSFGSITIDESIFDNNTITNSQSGFSPGNAGGGAFVSSSSSVVTISNSTFSNNKALGLDANSGGLDLNAKSNSNILVDRVKITGNHADDDTGGLYMGSVENSVITVRSTTISGNTSNNNRLCPKTGICSLRDIGDAWRELFSPPWRACRWLAYY